MALLCLSVGCRSLGYVVEQGLLQLHYACSDRPIEEVLRDPATPASWKRKLALVRQVRAFAGAELAMTPGNSYTGFLDLGEKPVAWNLSACEELSLRPRRWDFPIVGSVEYLGFFREASARAWAEDLRQAGLDVHVRPVLAYSTLGWFDDPVTSAFLRLDDADLAALLFHELAHATIWFPGDVPLNESLGSFVEREGTRAFLRAEGAPRAPALAEFDARVADDARFGAIIEETLAALESLYASDASDAQKRREKARLIEECRWRVQDRGADLDTARYRFFADMPLNNAVLLAFRRYHGDIGIFEALFARVGGRFSDFWRVLQAIRDEGRSPRASLSGPRSS